MGERAVLQSFKKTRLFTDRELPFVSEIVDRLPGRILTEEQLTSILQSHSFTRDQLGLALKILRTHFPQNIIAAGNGEVNADATELLRQYTGILAGKFNQDELYIFHLADECRISGGESPRFSLFLEQAPYLLSFPGSRSETLLTRGNLLASLKNRIRETVVTPLKKLVTTPGECRAADFRKYTGLEGENYTGFTRQLERGGYLDMDESGERIYFQQGQISRSYGSFIQAINKASAEVLVSYTTVQKIIEFHTSLRELPPGSPLQKVCQRISAGPFIPQAEGLVEPGPGADPAWYFSQAYLLLCLHFHDRVSGQDGFNKQEYIRRGEVLARELIKRDLVCAGEEEREITARAMGCLSLLPGNALRLIDEYYADNKGLTYSYFAAALGRVYT